MKRNLDKKKLEHLEGHSLSTRRDFLSHGFISFAALTSMPSILSLGFQQAAAQEAQALAPFMTFDMAGGAALPGNFLVGNQGGPEDLLESYSQIGWDPRESGALNKEFGLPMSANHSGMLRGLLATTTEGNKSIN